MDNPIFAGIVIDRVSPKTDLFYYSVPSSLSEQAKVGARVIVPFGEKNELHAGLILRLTKTPPEFKVKKVIEIIEEPLFSKKIYELFFFTSNNFIIPLHSLVNKLIRTTASTRIEKLIESINIARLEEIYNSSKGIKKELVKILLEKKFISVYSLKKKFKSNLSRYLTEFQKNGIIAFRNIKLVTKSRILTLNTDDRENIFKTINQIENNYKKRAIIVCERLLSSYNKILDEPTLIKRVKDGKNVIDLLIEKNIISEQYFKKDNKTNFYKLETICGESLEKRSLKIIERIKKNLDPEERALVIFPEIVLINRVKDIYENAFGSDLAVWEGKGKLQLIEQIKVGKKVILTTPFSLFLDIQNLKTIIIEEANSKYLKPGKFINFDVTIVAIKRAYNEKIHLILSSAIPDENIVYMFQKGLINNCSYPGTTNSIKVIDMRREFKRKNRSMLSYYLEKRIKDILNQNGNIAMLINRKPYSTFIMCRECGYILRCPVCKSSLYLNIETKKLFCPLCGHEENIPERCPRCGSINIHYFGGGIQKLSKEIKTILPDTNLIELMSDKKSKKPTDSKNFKKTIFIGTEFLISNLTLSNINLFGFVSIDTFLQHFMFDSAGNTMRIFSEVLTEMNGKEIIVQTYLPENYTVKTFKKLDFERFYKGELYLRKELGYPPYKNLILINAIGKEGSLETLKNFLDKIKNQFKDRVEILGPAVSSEEFKKGYSTYEATIKTFLNPGELKETYLNFLNSTNIKLELRVFPIPDISLQEN